MCVCVCASSGMYFVRNLLHLKETNFLLLISKTRENSVNPSVTPLRNLLSNL